MWPVQCDIPIHACVNHTSVCCIFIESGVTTLQWSIFVESSTMMRRVLRHVAQYMPPRPETHTKIAAGTAQMTYTPASSPSDFCTRTHRRPLTMSTTTPREPAITVFFLENSRAIRPVWLLEALGVPYTLESTGRNASRSVPAMFVGCQLLQIGHWLLESPVHKCQQAVDA